VCSDVSNVCPTGIMHARFAVGSVVVNTSSSISIMNCLGVFVTDAIGFCLYCIVAVAVISVLVVFVSVKGSRSKGGSGRLSSGAGYW